METYAFDIEIFPNFFSAIFINVDNTFDEEIFIVYKNRNDLEKLKFFVNRKIMLVGYNSIHFDNVILNGILEGEIDLHGLGTRIIDNKDNSDQKVFRLRYKKVPYKTLDFKEMIGLDISLKQVCVTLEWDRIQDLPFEPSKIIEDRDIEEILSYNRNDVLPLIFLYKNLTDELELRNKVNSIYNVNVTGRCESGISNVIFENLYSRATGLPIKKIKEGRTFRDKVLLKDCLIKPIEFKIDRLKKVIRKIGDINLISENFDFSLMLRDFKLNFGKGGLHSDDSPGIFETNEVYSIIDADATSFYPYLILFNNLKPAHLTNNFLEIFGSLLKERVIAKENKDKVVAAILKMVVVAPFGKYGCPSYWLYDPLAFYSVTLSGQFSLLVLMEEFYLNDIEIISANTDGITCKVKKEKEDLYKSICDKWGEKFGFKLDIVQYSKYVRRDVNNYIAIYQNGNIKRKGIFCLPEDEKFINSLKRSCNSKIIPKALTNYFVYNIAPLETLETSKNIFDFLMSQRVGKQFDTIYRNGKGEERLQKTNRFYASNGEGTLIKRDKVENGKQREIGILCGVPVMVANNIDRKKPFEEYQVNLDYYRKEIEKIINTIEKIQLELF